MKVSKTVIGLLAALAAGQLSAAVVGNFIGSSRSWNNGDMSTLKATAIGAGHTVEADEAITAGNLANNTHFVFGEPTVSLTAGELSTLTTWVSGGGILLLLADSGNSGLPALNNIAAGIGSALNWNGSAGSSGLLAGGNFATTGGPFNIVGSSLSLSPGTAVVAGGIALAGDNLRVEQIGAGYVFGFSDRSDHNVFSPTNANVNGQLFLNILAGPGGNPPVPDSGSSAVLLALGLGLLAFARNRVRR